jgi:hypothetical protein
MNNELERMWKIEVMEFMWRDCGNSVSWLRFVPGTYQAEKVSPFEPTYNEKFTYNT